MTTHTVPWATVGSVRVPDGGDRILLGPNSQDWLCKAAENPRHGFSQLTPTYLLPLLSSHLPFLLFIGLIPYKDLLDTFWCILGTKDRQNCQ